MDGADLVQILATSGSDGLVDAGALNMIGELFAYWNNSSSAPSREDTIVQWLIHSGATGKVLVERYDKDDIPGTSERLAKEAADVLEKIESELSDVQRRFYDKTPSSAALFFVSDLLEWISHPNTDKRTYMAAVPATASASEVLDHMLVFLERTMGIETPSTLMLARTEAYCGDTDLFMRSWVEKMNRDILKRKYTKIRGFCDNMVDGIPDSMARPDDINVNSEHYQWMISKKVNRNLQQNSTQFRDFQARITDSLLNWYTAKKPAAERRALLVARLCAFGLEAQTALWNYFTEERLSEYPYNQPELGLEKYLQDLRRIKSKRRCSNTDKREMIRIYLALALTVHGPDLPMILKTSKSAWERVTM